MTLQFILYNLTVLFVIAHFFDSAKEKEWTEPLYRGSYLFWLISSLALMAVALAGIMPCYEQTMAGNVFSFIMAIGGLSGYGYHKVAHMKILSEVCRNRQSYVIMWILNVASLTLICVTMYNNVSSTKLE